MAVSQGALDLDAYLNRIGISDSIAVDEDSLRAIQWGQASTIPFENFDILLGRQISLEPLDYWISPHSGSRYPVAWRLDWPHPETPLNSLDVIMNS